MELVALEHEAKQARSVRDLFIAEMEQSNADRRELLNQGQLDVDALARIEVYHQDLSEGLKQQQAVVADVEARVVSKREELLKVQQDREILDELKRRQLREFQQRLDRAEARLIDESAITGSNRRRMADG
ncbi:MAG: flagellar FliJ family protein [Anaerolineae bacterium]